VFDDDFDDRELLSRMHHVTACMRQTLPGSYRKALTVLKKAVPDVTGFEAMCLPDFVERYGLDDWDRSLPAMAHFTKYSSSEFAIRPFILADQPRALAYLERLAGNRNARIRRFASEGCRPRLPWAMALPPLKKDPAPILPILETLKDDDDDSVRRSVANNLNDISKDNPEFALAVCERWHGTTPNTDWIVKHACRTLLKAGNKRAMLLFGFADPARISVEDLRFEPRQIAIGDTVGFAATLRVRTRQACKVRLEYAVYFVKARGKTSRKVFKISEKSVTPGRHSLRKLHSFADQSTRKHYPGKHEMAIIVNGVEKARGTVALR